MLIINGVRYESVEVAGKKLSLPLSLLKKDFFTFGYGDVTHKGVTYSVYFDGYCKTSAERDKVMNKWITANYQYVMDKVEKYYSKVNEDIISDVWLHCINKVKEDKVRNLEQCFFNRLQGAYLDDLRMKKSNKSKMCVSDDVVKIDQVKGEMTYTQCADETVFDKYFSTPEPMESVNTMIMIDIVKIVLADYHRMIDIDMYLEYTGNDMNKSYKGQRGGYAATAKKFDVSVSTVVKAVKEVRESLTDKNIRKQINELFEESKYKTFDDYKLEDF